MKFSDVFPAPGVGCSCNNGVGCVGCAMGVGCSKEGNVGCASGSCSAKQGGRGYGPSIDTQASFFAPSVQAVRFAAGRGSVGSVDDLLATVNDAELFEVTGKVDLLMADVERVQDDAEKQGKKVPAFDTWTLLTWNPWYLQYKFWVGAHESTLSRTGGGVRVEFDNLRSQLNVRIQEFQDLGGKTAVAPIDTTAPPPPPPEEDQPNLIERIFTAAGNQMMLTTLLAGGGLLAYWHFVGSKSVGR